MTETEKAPILVTGAHRSGTTWVGKMLCASRQAAYISEPLNKLHHPGLLDRPVPYWYLYLNPANEADYLPGLQNVLRFRYHWGKGITNLRSWKDLLRLGRDVSIYQLGRLRRQRPLLKDPFAVFSIPWFIERLGCRVVVTVRHPAAFASSLKRLNWPFDFRDLLAQTQLMHDWLEPFRAAMQTLSEKVSPAGQGAPAALEASVLLSSASLLWQMIYQTVNTLQQRYPDLIVVRQEDLALDPLAGFRELYRQLGLDFNDRARQTILNSSSSDNPKEGRAGAFGRRTIYTVNLDSRATLQSWKRRLTPEEILLVREMTESAASRYYPEITWG